MMSVRWSLEWFPVSQDEAASRLVGHGVLSLQDTGAGVEVSTDFLVQRYR